jgi:UDP-N-acetylglucosamine 2-epimerase (non-hydrolysing)
MLDQVVELFQIKPQYDLDLMCDNQDLSELTAQILTSLKPILDEVRPTWVLVQGDTTTSMAASLATFYHRGALLGHVEAGLRTHNKHAPFPEEINRRMTSVLADLHFSATEGARQALLTEGVSPESILVTGNTVVDALLWVRDTVRANPPVLPSSVADGMRGKRVVLVTGHRRESFGAPFEQICFAIRDIVAKHPDVCVVYPVHLNPNVQEPVRKILGSLDRVHLAAPLPYAAFVYLMDRAHVILTDSGGIQEEAPSLGKPVLVMREVTERPEGIVAECAALVGIKRADIVEACEHVLTDGSVYSRMARGGNPYGDGLAAKRIVSAISDMPVGR